MTRLDHGHGQEHTYVTSDEDSPYTKSTVLSTGHGVAHAYVTSGRRTAARQVLYHGTNISNVRQILPASQHGKGTSYAGETDPDYAYATPNLDDAWEYAMEAHGQHADRDEKSPGRPRVYEVHPIGGDHHVEEDPAYHPDGTWRGVRDDDKRSPVGFDVHREMEAPHRVKRWFHQRGDHWFEKPTSEVED